MRSLSSLLQDADPLRHEAPLSESVREQFKATVLGNVPADLPNAQVNRRRRALTAAIALAALGAAAFGREMFLGTTPVLAAVRFEVRLAENSPVPGLVVAQLPGSGGLIYLHPEIVVSNEDIAQSWVTEDGANVFGVAVQLLPSGVERMRQATTAHVGRPLAIIIDGSVVSAPVVRGPIGDSAVINGSFTRGEAERLAEGMKLR